MYLSLSTINSNQKRRFEKLQDVRYKNNDLHVFKMTPLESKNKLLILARLYR